MDNNNDLLPGIRTPLPGIATLMTNERSRSISPYLIARSL